MRKHLFWSILCSMLVGFCFGCQQGEGTVESGANIGETETNASPTANNDEAESQSSDVEESDQ